MKKQDNQNQQLISQLIASASCKYKPDGKHECGRKHGQMEEGKPVSLFEARILLEVKGIICNKCIKLLAKVDIAKYSFVPIAEVAGQSVFFAQSKKDTDPDGGGKRDKSERRNRQDDRRPREQRQPEPQAPKPVTPGGAIRAKITEPEQLAWFDHVVRRASKLQVPVMHQLAWTSRGRHLLCSIGLSKALASVEHEALYDVLAANTRRPFVRDVIRTPARAVA